MADNEILKRLAPGDLVITQDVPLADEVVRAGAVAINPRGTTYTPDNVHEHLVRRNRAEKCAPWDLRAQASSPLPKPIPKLNALDRALAQR